MYIYDMKKRSMQEPTFLILTALAAGPQHGYGIITDAEGSRVTLAPRRACGEAPVMTGPGDEMSTAGRGRPRASRADREQVIDTLKAAFVQGLLTKDELDARVGQAFASRTRAELAAVTTGIPAGPAPAQPLRKPARAQARPPENEAADSSQNKVVNACAGATATALALGVALYAFHAGNFGLLFVVLVVLLAIAGAWSVAGIRMISSLREKRSRGSGCR